MICGDNEIWLNDLSDKSIDLCYIDPPFFSNQNYEVIWGNGYEIRSFGDRFSGGISHYIEWMRPRIKLIHSKIKDTGYIALHCDYHASHRLRVLLDEIFGEKNFINEIIWHYKRWPINQKAFQKMHDNIFIYAKNIKANRTFNTILGERTESTIKRWKNKKIQANHKNGKRIPSTSNSENSAGVPIDDVFEIPIIAPVSKERIGYPTQKPERLIAQIIKCLTNTGDTVLDCFVGGGSTAKVCSDLKRYFIVGDVSPVAIKITANRLDFDCPDTRFEIKNVPTTENEYKKINGHKFAETVCDLMGWAVNEKKSDDGGIDAWDGMNNPIQIKNHNKATGRPDIQRFFGALAKGKNKKGIFVAWEFSRAAFEYIAEMKREYNIEIVPFKCSEVFKGLLIQEDKQRELNLLYKERFPEIWKSGKNKASSNEIKRVLDKGNKIKEEKRKSGKQKNAA